MTTAIGRQWSRNERSTIIGTRANELPGQAATDVGVPRMSDSIEALRSDVRRAIPDMRKLAMGAFLFRCFTQPGIHAVVLLRLQDALYASKSRRLAWLTYILNVRLTGAEFGPGCSIGGGLLVRHPMGIVVSNTATIGTNCKMLQHVTIGENLVGVTGAPNIGDGVLIGAGAVIVGPVIVGSHSLVGANAVVVEDVPADVTVAGVPARVVRQHARGTTQ
jgi:serine O-acetyltransferase